MHTCDKYCVCDFLKLAHIAFYLRSRNGLDDRESETREVGMVHCWESVWEDEREREIWSERVKTIAHGSLDHVRSLRAEMFDGVEHVDEALRLHPLYGYTQSTEGTCSTYASTANTEWEIHT